MTNKIFPIAKRTIEVAKLLKGQIGLLELNSHYQIMRKDANALIHFLLILKSVVFFILYRLHSSSSSLFISFHSLPQPHHHRHHQTLKISASPISSYNSHLTVTHLLPLSLLVQSVNLPACLFFFYFLIYHFRMF